MKKIYVLPLIVMLVFAISCAKDSPTENDGWEIGTPENLGLDADELERMINRIARSRRIRSFLMVKDGYIVAEHYSRFWSQNSAFRQMSVSKSVTSALIGIAIDEGLIECVDTPIKEFFPEFCAERPEITIRHLLSMTTGWDWPEVESYNRSRWLWNWVGTFYWDWLRSRNQVKFVLERPHIYTPGYFFNYNTGTSHLLAAILQKASGMPGDEYARTRLFDKIGITSARWTKDRQGVIRGGSGLFMTARDAAKFGQLFLNRGEWNGEQIIPEEWVDISTTPQSHVEEAYSQHGFHWWIRERVVEDMEYGMFYASGHGGQYIFVIPEHNTVICFTSRVLSNNPSTPHLHYIHYFRTHFPNLFTNG